MRKNCYIYISNQKQMKYASEKEYQAARKEAVRNAKEEGQNGARAGRLFDMRAEMEIANRKKAGEIVQINHYSIHKYEQHLNYTGPATLLEDCSDGDDGIYLTDKGAFFSRNSDRVCPQHPIYKRAFEKGYITPGVQAAIDQLAPIDKLISGEIPCSYNQKMFTCSLLKLKEDYIGLDYDKKEIDIYEAGEELVLLSDSRDFNGTLKVTRINEIGKLYSCIPVDKFEILDRTITVAA